MKKLTTMLVLFTSLTALPMAPAQAANSAVDGALRGHAEVSTFYQALINTGVMNELDPNATYTVFAPTNQAFNLLTRDAYPCYYSGQCNAEVAAILRNHIVRGEVYIADAAHNRGGVYSVSGRFVNIGEPYRNNYAVDGKNIVYTSWLPGVMFYEVDGLIARPGELAALEGPVYTPERVTTQTTQHTIPDPACGPQGCVDAVSQTTTVTRTVVTPAR